MLFFTNGMKVILKQNIKGIGKKYEIKDVSSGYAANFLLPEKLAEYATPEAIKRVELLKSQLIADIEIKENLAKKSLEVLKDMVVSISKKANEKGSLFSSIHKEEIVEAIKSQTEIELSPEFIELEKPIKELGDHKIKISVGKNRNEFILRILSS